jgi:hypothetical protein
MDLEGVGARWTAVMIAIRAPHGHRNRSVKVATSYKTRLETGLLALA